MMKTKKFELKQGEYFNNSEHITFFEGVPSEFHSKMVSIMEKTMLVPKSYYMRSWYEDDDHKIRVYDYGCHYDFFYLIEIGEQNV